MKVMLVMYETLSLKIIEYPIKCFLKWNKVLSIGSYGIYPLVGKRNGRSQKVQLKNLS